MSKPDGGPAFPICPGQECDASARFLKYVDLGDGDLDKCWLWLGGKTPKGYGIFWLRHGVSVRAHRYALSLYSGRVPSQYVLHKCDNPSCVNPTHLIEGTHGDNMKQMADRKRATREERHHKAVLRRAEVAAIVLLHRGAAYTTRELASMFGVHQATVAEIIQGKLWPDVYALADAMLAESAKEAL